MSDPNRATSGAAPTAAHEGNQPADGESVATTAAAAPALSGDVPRFDTSAVGPELRAALGELLFTLADDEFVQGFRDSEWTGIAPMLEEDVAFSSLAQDEIGHARVFYELAAALSGTDADSLAYDRGPAEYRHCRLLDHPRGDWAFTIARRYLYDTADEVRLAALAESRFQPLREVVAKVRREERYHVMHLSVWLRRLATSGDEPRARLARALEVLWPDALSVFAPLADERVLLDEGVLATPMADLAGAQWARLRSVFGPLDLAVPDSAPGTTDGRRRAGSPEGFEPLWTELTSVRQSEPGASW